MKTVYYNPRCMKCRIAKQALNAKNITYNIYEYLEEGITIAKLKEILHKGLELKDMLRTNEPDYKEHIKGKDLSEDEILEIITKYPKILQRPIILSENNAVIARDTKTLDALS